MRRSIAVIVMMLLFFGCKGPEQATAPADPFFGRTRIEPPRTGSIAAPRASDPYYSGTRQASGSNSSVQPGSAIPTNSAGSGGWQPATATESANSGLRLQKVSPLAVTPSPIAASSSQSARGDLVTVPTEARQPTPTAPVASDTVSSTYDAARQIASSIYQQGKTVYQEGKTAVLANRERIVRVIEPRAQQNGNAPVEAMRSTGATHTPSEPRNPSSAGGKAVNIIDLPEVRRSSAAVQQSGNIHKGGILLTSATEEFPPSQADSPGRYGYDPEYRWLVGQLEYSQTDRAWKLRYIPVDGVTDEYGGSMRLPDSPLLSGYERGDFVEINGRPVASKAGEKTFSGAYEIREIRRLAP